MNIDAATVAVIVGGVNILATILGGGFLMGRLTGRLDIQDVRIGHIEVDVRDTKKLLISSAVDASRLNRAEGDINSLGAIVNGLRRGVGFIRDGGETSVDREY